MYIQWPKTHLVLEYLKKHTLKLDITRLFEKCFGSSSGEIRVLRSLTEAILESLDAN